MFLIGFITRVNSLDLLVSVINTVRTLLGNLRVISSKRRLGWWILIDNCVVKRDLTNSKNRTAIKICSTVKAMMWLLLEFILQFLKCQN